MVGSEINLQGRRIGEIRSKINSNNTTALSPDPLPCKFARYVKTCDDHSAACAVAFLEAIEISCSGCDDADAGNLLDHMARTVPGMEYGISQLLATTRAFTVRDRCLIIGPIC